MLFFFCFVFFIFSPLFFLTWKNKKINHKSRRQDEITRDYRKMNYLPNRWRQRAALHWLQAVSRLRCSARSTVVYHPAVFGTLWNHPGTDKGRGVSIASERQQHAPIYTFFMRSKRWERRRRKKFLFTCCLTSVDRSPRIGPNPVNSVSLRMTHSMSSRSDNSNAFQCSVLFSRRFLQGK